MIVTLAAATLLTYTPRPGPQAHATLLTYTQQSRQSSPKPFEIKNIGLWVAKDIAPSQKIRLNINTRNISSLQISAQKVSDPIAWFLDTHRSEPAAGKVVGNWPMSMLNKGDKPTPYQSDRYYSKQVNLPPLPPGVYKIHASGGGESKWAVVNVTHLAIVAKRSNYRTLLWVTDALNGNNLQGARIDEYRLRVPAKQHTTDRDGLAVFTEPTREAKFIVTRGKDMAMMPFQGPMLDGTPRVHFQTDRPVYRPGQTVQFKAIVRTSKGQNWESISNTEFSVQMRDPKDEVLDKQTLTTNAIGTLNGKFQIPSEAATGPYSIVIHNMTLDGYATFTVAAYRKPEYKVDVQPATKRYLAGEPITFNVNTSYYFGAPLQQAQVHYVVRRSPLSYWGSSEDDEMYYSGDGNLYAQDEYGSDDVVTEDTTQTDEKGNAIIQVKTEANRPDMTYSISIDVTDASRRQVSSGSSVPVYTAAIRLGLRSQMIYVPLGGLIPVEVSSKDLDGKATSANVTLQLIEHVWNKKSDKYDEVLLAKTSVKVPATGKALAKLPARAQGDLEIRATAPDKTGRVAKAFMTMYVAGPNSKGEQEDQGPEMKIRLDKKSYKPGDTVSANINSNFKGSSVLVTAEGEDLFSYAVLPANSDDWSVKTNANMSPNAFVTATRWSKGQMVSANAIVPLPDPKRLLVVKATPNKAEYKPGEPATYKITTTDQEGKPVSTEVALSVVDEAIYAVRGDTTPDLAKFYWGTRSNRVSTTYSAPEEVSGGAYQRVNPAAPVRQRFEDTAYWGPTVQTDKNGEATVDFQMPDNLTSWRAVARGVTLSTQVGMGMSMVVANRPVMMRLSTPRQMVVGDELTILSSVNNRTNTSRDFKSMIEPTGIDLDGSQGQTLTVGANSEGHLPWIFRATKLPETGMASILGTTEPPDKNADFSDALRVGFPIIPKGVLQKSMSGGMFTNHVDAQFNLPSDRIEPASSVQLKVWAGLQPLMKSQALEVLDSYRYGATIAADQLMAAAAIERPSDDRSIREAHAMLSRMENYDGWGWWEGARSNPRVTEHVLTAIARTNDTPAAVSERMKRSAQNASEQAYNQSQLWDLKASLASALVLSKAPHASDHLDEVMRRGIKMSPYARLRVAEALAMSGNPDDAQKIVTDALTDAEIGPSSAKVPAGEGLGWMSTDTETTAQALLTLHALRSNEDLQAKLARELAQPEDGWMPCNDKAMVVIALAAYLKDHPDATDLGDIRAKFNGTDLVFTASKLKNEMITNVPRTSLTSENAISLERGGGGQAFYELRAQYYSPQLDPSETGIAVIRRFEAMSANGVWHQLAPAETVTAGEPIRSTVLAWGEGPEQASRISEPIPAGFEYVQDEGGDDGIFEQVRDGSVEHYVMTSSEPLHFTYYLRAESTGTVTALPATAELLRNPSRRGQSSAQTLKIVAK